MLFWILTFTVVLIVWYLNIPVPRDATEPWKLKFTAILMKIQGDLTVIYALITRKTPHVELRAQFERLMKFLVFFQPRIDGIEETVDNFNGALVRIFKPKTASSELPGVIYIHGGGWYTFSTKFYSYFTKLLSKKANAVVVSIEYRLAPENVFPAGFDDCVNAAKYFLKNSKKYDVDPKKVGIAAFSSNTHVSAKTRKVYRSRVDPGILQGKYKIEPSDDVETNNMDLAKKVEHYILNPYFSPLMATNEQLSKLPRIFLITCEYDPLRDDGLILSESLKGIGHQFEHLHLPGSEHGVLIFPYYSVYKSTMDKIALYIKRVGK